MPSSEVLGALARAVKELRADFAAARLHWDDEVAAAFEAKYLDEVERDFRIAASSIEAMAATLRKLRSELS